MASSLRRRLSFMLLVFILAGLLPAVPVRARPQAPSPQPGAVTALPPQALPPRPSGTGSTGTTAAEAEDLAQQYEARHHGGGVFDGTFDYVPAWTTLAALPDVPILTGNGSPVWSASYALPAGTQSLDLLMSLRGRHSFNDNIQVHIQTRPAGGDWNAGHVWFQELVKQETPKDIAMTVQVGWNVPADQPLEGL